MIHRLLGVAEYSGRLDQCAQHRRQIERGPTDDLEHIGGRRLLLKRFLEVARLRLHLVEQARILDGDHRLVSEGSHELDLARRERARLGAQQRENAVNYAVAK